MHELCLVIGLAKTRQILFFHAFTGCDVVSAFRGKGKKSAWLTWDAYTEVSDVFAKLSQAASGVNHQYINQKHRILHSGVGEKKMVCGTFSGHTFYLLPRVVSS